MKKALIPIDGSSCSLRAVELLISKRALYSNPDDLEIHLLNVQAPLSHDVTRFVSHEQTAAFHREESEKTLLQARQLLDAAGARYICHHAVGNVAETIAKLADTLQCDQIIMGTQGRSALQDFLMNSITIKVVSLANKPVLLVK